MKCLFTLLVLCTTPQSFASEIHDECFYPDTSPDPVARQAVEKLVTSFIEGADKNIYPKAWSQEKQAEGLDINLLTQSQFEEGRSYGAVAFEAIPVPYEKAKQALLEPDSIMLLVRNVSTLKENEKIESMKNKVNEFCIKTAINVPVISDIHTHVRIRLFEATPRRLVLEWKQMDAIGELSYNHGASILEANGDGSKLTVIGVHVLKNEERVPWLGRATARSFAKSHYGNFLEAWKVVFRSAKLMQ